MSTYIDLLVSTLTQGLIYAQLSYGVFITYKILDFPDLTVDGSFPLGAAVTAVLLVGGATRIWRCSSRWAWARWQGSSRASSMCA